jgi:hypothetical protein
MSLYLSVTYVYEPYLLCFLSLGKQRKEGARPGKTGQNFVILEGRIKAVPGVAPPVSALLFCCAAKE